MESRDYLSSRFGVVAKNLIPKRARIRTGRTNGHNSYLRDDRYHAQFWAAFDTFVAGGPLFGPRYSITSSAVARIVAGMVSPIAPAATPPLTRMMKSRRLMMSSDKKHRWIL
jgi:hypothetical protein